MSKIIRDRFALNSDLRVGSVQRPPFKGVLYRDDGVNEYGRHVFTKVNENIVTLGGSITALEKLAGVTAAFKPNSINDIMGINTGHDYHPDTTTVALFGVGTGGAALDFANVFDPSVKQNIVADMVPMMVSENDLTGADASKYMMKSTITTSGGTQLKCWYLKEFETTPIIRSLWKDAATDEEDGSEITDDISESESLNDVEAFVQYKLKITQYDVRSYFEAMGMLNMARYNSIGLYTGEKILLPDGTYDYVNVRLFSVVNINNEPLDQRKEITYYYRVYAMV